MLSKCSLWVFGLIVAVFLFFGCTSGRNEATPASASPTPPKGPQQGASLAPPRTTGHTEAHGGGGAISDEREHCFKRDDTRDLILTFTDKAVQQGTSVSALIIDTGTGTVVEDIPTIAIDAANNTATITFSDAAVPGAQRSTAIMHLGPGPYTEVTIVDPTGGTGPASAGHKLRTGDIYTYITVDDPKTHCP